jgi:hypothetical protein
MAYLETSRPDAATSDSRRPLAPAPPDARAARIGRPAPQHALRAEARQVRQMLAAALLAGALILAVAMALLVRS